MKPFLSYPLEILKKERDKLEKKAREKALQGERVEIEQLIDLAFAIKILEALASREKEEK